MIKQLLNEFVKNIKIMFRNFTSVMLLIVVPLIMILIIGYAFSNEDVSGIKIGIVSSDTTQMVDLSLLQTNVSNYAKLMRFSDLPECIIRMERAEIHICVKLENVSLNSEMVSGPVSGAEDIPSGKITYYYDNSRKKVSLGIIQKMQEFFGVKAEQISIEATTSIIENIQNLISFINDRRADIETVKTESVAIKQELITRKARLEEVRNNFLPSYIAVKELQLQIHNYSEEFNSSALLVYDAVDKTASAINTYREYSIMDVLNSTTTTISDVSGNISKLINSSSEAINITSELLNISNLTESLTTGLDQLTGAAGNLSEVVQGSGQINIDSYYNLSIVVDQLELSLIELANATNDTMDQLNSAVGALDMMVGQLDEINITLEDEIRRSDEYIFKIDASIAVIDKVSKELDEKLSQLNKLQPGYAEKIIKPLTYDYEMLLKNSKNIQIAFPSLLAIIVMFIAVLFSNIIVLMEIHNKANLRNMISPVNDLVFMLGMVITSTVLIMFQVIVLLLVAQTKFLVNVNSVFWQLGIVCLLLVLIYVLIGMIIAYLARDVQTSILVTTFFVLTLFMFSNAIVPIEAMPGPAAYLSSHNPMVVGEFLIKQIQLFNTPLELLMSSILLLVGYLMVLFLIAVIVIKQENKKRV